MLPRPHILVLLILTLESAFGQEGPIIPCTDCDKVTIAPFPETGHWYNPDQSGSGINLEVQDGYLLGTYYGYDAEGYPEWRLFHGPLVRSEKENVLWEIETDMARFEGGNCPTCAYQSPTVTGEAIPVRLEFPQRYYMQVYYDDAPSQNFIPLMFNSAGKKFFSETTDHLFPVHGTPGNSFDEDYSNFVFIYRPNPTELFQEHLWKTFYLKIRRAGRDNKPPDGSKLWRWSLEVQPSQIEGLVVGEISCRSFPETEPDMPPSCKLRIVDFVNNQPEKIEFIFPAAWFGDSRIYTEGEDGSALEGYRLDYD